MTAFLQRLTGLSTASPLDAVKFLAANVVGKASAVLVTIATTCYIFGPALPEKVQAFAFRLMVGCAFYLLAIIAWRQGKNQSLLKTGIAKAIVADPNSTNTFPDAGVQREIDKEEVKQRAAGAPEKDPR